MKSPRRYEQRRRAESAAETERRILDATSALFLATGEVPTLEAVASRAGVAVQTVLRRFGSKEGLVEAAAAEARTRVADARGAAPTGDLVGIVANLMDHYAAWGELSLRLQHLEGRSPTASQVLHDARALHRAWVERVFAPQLAALDAGDRPRRLTELVVVTDVYVWKLLHRDQGLARHEHEATLVDLLQRVLA